MTSPGLYRKATTEQNDVVSLPPVKGELTGEERALVRSWRDPRILLVVIPFCTAVAGACTAVISMRKPALDATIQLTQLQAAVGDLAARVDGLAGKQAELTTAIHDQSTKLQSQIDGAQKDLNIAERDIQEMHLRVTLLESRR